MRIRGIALIIFVGFLAGQLGASEKWPISEIVNLEHQIKKVTHAKLSQVFKGLKEKDVEMSYQGLDLIKKKVPDLATYYQINSSKKEMSLGYNSVAIFFYGKEDEFLSRATIIVKSKAWGNFIYAKDIIGEQQLITIEYLKFKRERLYNKPKYAIMNKENVIGKEAEFKIQADSPIYEWMLKDKPVIRKGEKIKVHFQKNGVKLILKGTALEDGVKGKKIAARLTTKRIISGEVLGTANIKIMRGK